MAAAIVAVTWAKIAGDSYTDPWRTSVVIGIAPLSLSKPLTRTR